MEKNELFSPRTTTIPMTKSRKLRDLQNKKKLSFDQHYKFRNEILRGNQKEEYTNTETSQTKPEYEYAKKLNDLKLYHHSLKILILTIISPNYLEA